MARDNRSRSESRAPARNFRRSPPEITDEPARPSNEGVYNPPRLGRRNFNDERPSNRPARHYRPGVPPHTQDQDDDELQAARPAPRGGEDKHIPAQMNEDDYDFTGEHGEYGSDEEGYFDLHDRRVREEAESDLESEESVEISFAPDAMREPGQDDADFAAEERSRFQIHEDPDADPLDPETRAQVNAMFPPRAPFDVDTQAPAYNFPRNMDPRTLDAARRATGGTASFGHPQFERPIDAYPNPEDTRHSYLRTERMPDARRPGDDPRASRREPESSGPAMTKERREEIKLATQLWHNKKVAEERRAKKERRRREELGNASVDVAMGGVEHFITRPGRDDSADEYDGLGRVEEPPANDESTRSRYSRTPDRYSRERSRRSASRQLTGVELAQQAEDEVMADAEVAKGYTKKPLNFLEDDRVAAAGDDDMDLGAGKDKPKPRSRGVSRSKSRSKSQSRGLSSSSDFDPSRLLDHTKDYVAEVGLRTVTHEPLRFKSKAEMDEYNRKFKEEARLKEKYRKPTVETASSSPESKPVRPRSRSKSFEAENSLAAYIRKSRPSPPKPLGTVRSPSPIRPQSPGYMPHSPEYRPSSIEPRGAQSPVYKVGHNPYPPYERLYSPSPEYEAPRYGSQSPEFKPGPPDNRPRSPLYASKSPPYGRKSGSSPAYGPHSPAYAAQSPEYRLGSPDNRPKTPMYTSKSPEYPPKSGSSPAYVPHSPLYAPQSPMYRPTSPQYAPQSPILGGRSESHFEQRPVEYAPKEPGDRSRVQSEDRIVREKSGPPPSDPSSSDSNHGSRPPSRQPSNPPSKGPSKSPSKPPSKSPSKAPSDRSRSRSRAGSRRSQSGSHHESQPGEPESIDDYANDQSELGPITRPEGWVTPPPEGSSILRRPDAYGYIGATVRDTPALIAGVIRQLYGLVEKEAKAGIKRKRERDDDPEDPNASNIVVMRPSKRPRCNCYLAFCGCVDRVFGPKKAPAIPDLPKPKSGEIRITNKTHTEDITDVVLAHAKARTTTRTVIDGVLQNVRSDSPFEPSVGVKHPGYKGVITLPSTKFLPQISSRAHIAIRRRWARYANEIARFAELTRSEKKKTEVPTPPEFTFQVGSKSYDFVLISGDALAWKQHVGTNYESVLVDMWPMDFDAIDIARGPWKVEIPNLEAGMRRADTSISADRNIVFVVLKSYAPSPLPCWWFAPNADESEEPFIVVNGKIMDDPDEHVDLWVKLGLGNYQSINEISEDDMAARLQLRVDHPDIASRIDGILSGDWRLDMAPLSPLQDEHEGTQMPKTPKYKLTPAKPVAGHFSSDDGDVDMPSGIDIDFTEFELEISDVQSSPVRAKPASSPQQSSPEPVLPPPESEAEQILEQKIAKSKQRNATRDQYLNTVKWDEERELRYWQGLLDGDRNEANINRHAWPYDLDTLIRHTDERMGPLQDMRAHHLHSAHAITEKRSHDYHLQPAAWRVKKYKMHLQKDGQAKISDNRMWKADYWQIVEDHSNAEMERALEELKAERKAEEAERLAREVFEQKASAQFAAHQTNFAKLFPHDAREQIRAWQRLLSSGTILEEGDEDDYDLYDAVEKLIWDEINALKLNNMVDDTLPDVDGGEDDDDDDDDGDDDEHPDMPGNREESEDEMSPELPEGDQSEDEQSEDAQPEDEQLEEEDPLADFTDQMPEVSSSRHGSSRKSSPRQSSSQPRVRPQPPSRSPKQPSSGPKQPSSGSKQPGGRPDRSRSRSKASSEPQNPSSPPKQPSRSPDKTVSPPKAPTTDVQQPRYGLRPRSKTPAPQVPQAPKGPRAPKTPKASPIPEAPEKSHLESLLESPSRGVKEFERARAAIEVDGATTAEMLSAWRERLDLYRGKHKRARTKPMIDQWAECIQLAEARIAELQSAPAVVDGGGDPDDDDDDDDDQDGDDEDGGEDDDDEEEEDEDEDEESGESGEDDESGNDSDDSDPGPDAPDGGAADKIGDQQGRPSSRKSYSASKSPRASSSPKSRGRKSSPKQDSSPKNGEKKVIIEEPSNSPPPSLELTKAAAENAFKNLRRQAKKVKLEASSEYKFFQQSSVDACPYDADPDHFQALCLDEMQRIEQMIRENAAPKRKREEDEELKAKKRQRRPAFHKDDEKMFDTARFRYQLGNTADLLRRDRRKSEYIQHALYHWRDYNPQRVDDLQKPHSDDVGKVKKSSRVVGNHSVAWKMTLIASGLPASPIRENDIDYFDDELPDDKDSSAGWSTDHEDALSEEARLDELKQGGPGAGQRRGSSAAKSGSPEVAGLRRSARIRSTSKGQNDNIIPHLNPHLPDFLERAMDYTEGIEPGKSHRTKDWNRPMPNAHRNPEVRIFFFGKKAPPGSDSGPAWAVIKEDIFDECNPELRVQRERWYAERRGRTFEVPSSSSSSEDSHDEEDAIRPGRTFQVPSSSSSEESDNNEFRARPVSLNSSEAEEQQQPERPGGQSASEPSRDEEPTHVATQQDSPGEMDDGTPSPDLFSEEARQIAEERRRQRAVQKFKDDKADERIHYRQRGQRRSPRDDRLRRDVLRQNTANRYGVDAHHGLAAVFRAHRDGDTDVDFDEDESNASSDRDVDMTGDDNHFDEDEADPMDIDDSDEVTDIGAADRLSIAQLLELPQSLREPPQHNRVVQEHTRSENVTTEAPITNFGRIASVLARVLRPTAANSGEDHEPEAIDMDADVVDHEEHGHIRIAFVEDMAEDQHPSPVNDVHPVRSQGLYRTNSRAAGRAYGAVEDRLRARFSEEDTQALTDSRQNAVAELSDAQSNQDPSENGQESDVGNIAASQTAVPSSGSTRQRPSFRESLPNSIDYVARSIAFTIDIILHPLAEVEDEVIDHNYAPAINDRESASDIQSQDGSSTPVEADQPQDSNHGGVLQVPMVGDATVTDIATGEAAEDNEASQAVGPEASLLEVTAEEAAKSAEDDPVTEQPLEGDDVAIEEPAANGLGAVGTDEPLAVTTAILTQLPAVSDPTPAVGIMQRAQRFDNLSHAQVMILARALVESIVQQSASRSSPAPATRKRSSSSWDRLDDHDSENERPRKKRSDGKAHSKTEVAPGTSEKDDASPASHRKSDNGKRKRRSSVSKQNFHPGEARPETDPHVARRRETRSQAKRKREAGEQTASAEAQPSAAKKSKPSSTSEPASKITRGNQSKRGGGRGGGSRGGRS